MSSFYKPSKFDEILSKYEAELDRQFTEEQQENIAKLIKIVREVDKKQGTYSQSHRLYKPGE